MTIPEYLADFINVKPHGDQVEIYFTDIIWESAYTPTIHDVLVYTLPLARWEKDKEKYISRILNNKKYFRICGLCGEINHTGHMNDAYICQSCAVTYHHIVY